VKQGCRIALTGVFCALGMALCTPVFAQRLDLCSMGVYPIPDLGTAISPFSLTLLDDQPGSQPSSGSGTPAQKTPEPYKKEEFPLWLQEIWRFNVIFVGSIPFTYFFSLEGYDFYIYAISGFQASLAPWPFRPGSTIPYDAAAQTAIILIALTASSLIAVADIMIDIFLPANEKN
jgi:hypothetical protein